MSVPFIDRARQGHIGSVQIVVCFQTSQTSSHVESRQETSSSPLPHCYIDPMPPPSSSADSPPRPFPKGYFSVPFERFARDEIFSDSDSAFTLLGMSTIPEISRVHAENGFVDTIETYFDSRIDLIQRQLQKHSDRLKMKAEETFKIRDLSGDLLSENFEKEIKNFKLKVPHLFEYSCITTQLLARCRRV
jgi:hypothetical protein